MKKSKVKKWTFEKVGAKDVWTKPPKESKRGGKLKANEPCHATGAKWERRILALAHRYECQVENDYKIKLAKLYAERERIMRKSVKVGIATVDMRINVLETVIKEREDTVRALLEYAELMPRVDERVKETVRVKVAEETKARHVMPHRVGMFGHED